MSWGVESHQKKAVKGPALLLYFTFTGEMAKRDIQGQCYLNNVTRCLCNVQPIKQLNWKLLALTS